ncbi:MAG: TIM barrel protein, partial [Elusimicrobiota bacterium]
MEIGISTGFFHKQSIFDSLRLIRNSGIKYLELWTFSKMLDSTIHFNPADKKEIEKVKKLLNDYSIKAVSIHTPFSEDMDISSENENKRSESVNYAVLSAEALCKISDNDSKYDKTIVIHPSSVPLKNREKETKTKFNQAKRSIEEIYNKVKTLNVKLALENQLPHIFGSDAQT